MRTIARLDWIGGVLEQRRRLVESERKRLVEMQQTLTVEKAMLLIGAIGGIIKAHVHDRGDPLCNRARSQGSLTRGMLRSLADSLRTEERGVLADRLTQATGSDQLW